MHNCPTCGKETNGTWSEGGLKWAICDECMEAQRSESERERQTYDRGGQRHENNEGDTILV